jgi:predicted ATPase
MILTLTPTGIKSRLAAPLARYEFKPGINLLVGANGSGKSSLLHALRPKNMDAKLCDLELDRSKVAHPRLLFFDFEKDNPRTKSLTLLQADGLENFSRFSALFESKFLSHGESSRKLLRSLAAETKAEDIVVLDEPEQALDFEGLQLLKAVLAELPTPQVIIATHSPFLILEPSYHAIELTPGYRETVRSSLLGLLS